MSIYAKPEFYAHEEEDKGNQMEEIRLGLAQKLDVSAYADPKYSETIMKILRDIMVALGPEESEFIKNNTDNILRVFYEGYESGRKSIFGL